MPILNKRRQRCLRGPLEGEGSVFIYYQYVPSSGNDEVLQVDETSESIFALGKVCADTSHVHLEGS